MNDVFDKFIVSAVSVIGWKGVLLVLFALSLYKSSDKIITFFCDSGSALGRFVGRIIEKRTDAYVRLQDAKTATEKQSAILTKRLAHRTKPHLRCIKENKSKDKRGSDSGDTGTE